MDPQSAERSTSSDSESMMNHEEIWLSMFDLEKMALEHGLARLQGLVTEQSTWTPSEKCPERWNGQKKSCQMKLNHIPENEKMKILTEYGELAAKVLLVQQQVHELFASFHAPSSSNVAGKLITYSRHLPQRNKCHCQRNLTIQRYCPERRHDLSPMKK
ncbi:hypothetical protein T07_2395 [Trichinella nelsoni]|uniref:Uncharacterized protein n=1 Tax=Trichinella nelsoni TaxID=6336 RepID=A0A0V0RHM0_9BILA|nr:hypothetical protein T07_2395 [Trichinella nelsoni]